MASLWLTLPELLQAVDIHNRTVTFGQNGSSTKVDYDLLIGADGVNSRVRCSSLQVSAISYVLQSCREVHQKIAHYELQLAVHERLHS